MTVSMKTLPFPSSGLELLRLTTERLSLKHEALKQRAYKATVGARGAPLNIVWPFESFGSAIAQSEK